MALKEAFTIGVVLSAKDLYSRQFAKAQTDLKRLSRTAKDEAAKYERSLKFGKRMAMAGGMVLAASHAISRGLEEVTEKAMDLDQAVADVTTVMGDLAYTDQLRAKALEVSASVTFRATDVLRSAAYNLLSAGLTEEQTLAALDRVAKLGFATMGDLESASAIYGKIRNNLAEDWDMTALQEAKRITDGVAATVREFQTRGPELALALQYAIPSAKATRVEYEDMLATVGQLMQTMESSRAGTSYAAMMRTLPRLYEKFDVAVEDTNGKLRAVPDILDDLREALSQTSEVKKQVAITKALGEEGSRAVFLLMENTDAIREKTRVLKEGGATEEMYERRMAGSQAQMQASRNELENLTAVMADKAIPVKIAYQKALINVLKVMERLPFAKEALGAAALGAEIGKLAAPLIIAVGLLTTWNTQRKLAIALERSLNAEMAKGAVAGGAKGAGAAGSGAAGAGAAGAAGAGLGVAGTLAAVLAGIVGFSEGRKGRLYGLQEKYMGWQQGQVRRLVRRARGVQPLPFERGVPAQFQGGPLSRGQEEYARSLGGPVLPASGPRTNTVTIENMTFHITATGVAAEDYRRAAAKLGPYLGDWMRTQGRRN